MNPKKSAKLQLVEIHPANLIRTLPIGAVSANIIGFGEGEALQKICNALPIRQDIAF